MTRFGKEMLYRWYYGLVLRMPQRTISTHYSIIGTALA